MIRELLEELKGPAPGKAGGLATMASGAIAAALFAKCRYSRAEAEMSLLSQAALSDGSAFENYIKAKRAGEDVEPWLREATSSPLRAAEAALDLVDRLPEARENCPRTMIPDLLVGAHLLEASVLGSVELVRANLELFPSPWEEGERRLQKVCFRLRERDEYQSLFRAAETIAVIGISDSHEKPAYYVPSYLKTRGYRIWGVHPRGESAVAERTVRKLTELASRPDLVVIFRASDKVSEHLPELLEVSPAAVWLQLGIVNEDFANALRQQHIKVVSDRCAMLELQKLPL